MTPPPAMAETILRGRPVLAVTLLAFWRLRLRLPPPVMKAGRPPTSGFRRLWIRLLRLRLRLMLRPVVLLLIARREGCASRGR